MKWIPIYMPKDHPTEHVKKEFELISGKRYNWELAKLKIPPKSQYVQNNADLPRQYFRLVTYGLEEDLVVVLDDGTLKIYVSNGDDTQELYQYEPAYTLDDFQSLWIGYNTSTTQHVGEHGQSLLVRLTSVKYLYIGGNHHIYSFSLPAGEHVEAWYTPVFPGKISYAFGLTNRNRVFTPGWGNLRPLSHVSLFPATPFFAESIAAQIWGFHKTWAGKILENDSERNESEPGSDESEFEDNVEEVQVSPLVMSYCVENQSDLTVDTLAWERIVMDYTVRKKRSIWKCFCGRKA